jgi:amino acid permease
MFAKITYGAAGSLFVKLIIIINNIGLCCAYFIIFGTTCKNLVSVFVDEDSFWVTSYHNYIFILFIFLVMFSLVYKENLDSLRSASFLGVLGITIFFICLNIIFFYKIAQGKIESPTSEMLWPAGTTLDIIGCLPTVFLAFTFQFNVFPIFFTLKNKTKPEMIKGTIIAVAFCTITYSVTGIMGYIMYRDELKDTILQALTSDVKKYKGKDNFLIVLLVFINIGFLFSSTMSIPLMFFSLKNNFVNSIIFCKKKFFNVNVETFSGDKKTCIVRTSGNSNGFGGLSQSEDDMTNQPSMDKYNHTPMTKMVKYVIITILYIFICFVAIVIPELKVVMIILN